MYFLSTATARLPLVLYDGSATLIGYVCVMFPILSKVPELWQSEVSQQLTYIDPLDPSSAYPYFTTKYASTNAGESIACM